MHEKLEFHTKMFSFCDVWQKSIEEDLASLDADQVQMLKERCIQVNDQDEPIGPKSKVDLHIWDNIVGEEKILHRAFSVFLINMDKSQTRLHERALNLLRSRLTAAADQRAS